MSLAENARIDRICRRPEGVGEQLPKEFPIFEVIEQDLDPEFVSCLLRSRYYQRAFRAITTGHSNRRRTQLIDFEPLELCFLPTREKQRRLIAEINAARDRQQQAAHAFKNATGQFSDLIDGRHGEELPEVEIIEETVE